MADEQPPQEQPQPAAPSPDADRPSPDQTPFTAPPLQEIGKSLDRDDLETRND
jgi:hypothetical protein